jgi:hypothetical protein
MMQVLFHLFIYTLPLEIQLSIGDGCDPFNRFNPAILLCKAKARTWISNVICRGIFVSSELNLAVGVPFVDSDVIVDHHCLHLSSHNGVDPLTNPRQSIILHNILSSRKWQLLYIITNR